jgi:hypothetical protein
MWYEWESLESFNAWHDALCLSLGYPIYSINQQTGEIDLNAQATVAYTSVYEINGKWIARVESDHADGLTETALRLPQPEINV